MLFTFLQLITLEMSDIEINLRGHEYNGWTESTSEVRFVTCLRLRVERFIVCCIGATMCRIRQAEGPCG